MMLAKSKPLIDEIDRVLAKHYGFTDEELDFIINYDCPMVRFSKTEQFCRDILAWRKPLYTLESDANINLITLGAKPVSPEEGTLTWAFSLPWR